MACSYQTHCPSPLSGRARTSSADRTTQSSATKDQRGASGLFKKLLALKLTRKATVPKASGVNRSPYMHPQENRPSRYEQDTLVQRVSEALLLRGTRRRHARSDSFSSTSSSSSGGTPSLYSGSSSGASSPYSSGIFTPPDTPPQTPKKVGRREVICSTPKTPRAIYNEHQSTTDSLPTKPASASSVVHPAKHTTIKYRRATPPEPVTSVSTTRENTGFIDISCQPLRRPLNQPARSKASVLHAAVRNRETTPSPMPQPLSVPPPPTPSVFKLPPLPRYNPFIRARAESLSSLDRSSIKFSALPQSPQLTRSHSAPTGKESCDKTSAKASFIQYPDSFSF